MGGRTLDAALEHAAAVKSRAATRVAGATLRAIDALLAACSLLTRALRRVRRAAARRAAHPEVRCASSGTRIHGSRVLLVTHQLSGGAPQIVFEIARMLRAVHHEVTVLSPIDGPLASKLTEIGATVVIDAACLEPGSPTAKALARAADVAICNTVKTNAVVVALAPAIPTFWYIHEMYLVSDMLVSNALTAEAFACAHGVWAGSELSAALIRPHRVDVEVMLYGLDRILPDEEPGDHGHVRIGIFGSIEPRKGQDLAIAALALLSPSERRRVRLAIYGGVLDPAFSEHLQDAMRHAPEVTLYGELDADRYHRAMLACDAVLVPSRDDTLPLVSLDALGAGRVLICTATTGTSTYLNRGINGFVAAAPEASAIAAALSEALARRQDWPAIGAAAQALFAQTFSRETFTKRIHSVIGSALHPIAEPAH